MLFHPEVELIAAATILLFVHKDREIAVVVPDTRHIVEEVDALDIPERLTIAYGNLMARFDGGIDNLELAKPVGSADFIHLAVDAGADYLCLAGEAEILEVVYPTLGISFLHHHCTALDGIEDLGGVEAEGGHIAGIEDALAIHLNPECVGCVINDLEAVFIGYGLDGLGVTGLAVDVDRHYGCGPGGDCRLNAGRVDIACSRVNIHKHWSGAIPPDGMCCGHEAVW